MTGFVHTDGPRKHQGEKGKGKGEGKGPGKERIKALPSPNWRLAVWTSGLASPISAFTWVSRLVMFVLFDSCLCMIYSDVGLLVFSPGDGWVFPGAMVSRNRFF